MNKEWKAETFLDYAELLVDPEAAGISDAIIQFIFNGNDGGEIFYKISRGGVKACKGLHESPEVTISTTMEIWIQLILGKIRPIRTYISGKVKVKGDIVLAQKAVKLFRKDSFRKNELSRESQGDALYVINTDVSLQEVSLSKSLRALEK